MAQALIRKTVIDDWKTWLPQSIEPAQQDEYVSLSNFVRVIEQAASEANTPHLGWLIGGKCNYLSRGILGRAVLGSKTLGVGLHWLCRFYPLIQDATHVKLEVNDGLARLSYKILDPKIWPREQDALYTLSIFTNFLKAAAGDILMTSRIYLEAPKSQYNSELQRHLHIPITFGASANEIIFPAKFLQKPLAKNNPVTHAEISQLTRIYSEKNRKMKISDRVKYVIYTAILETQVSQEYVAKELGLSPRTLRRKLSAEALSYQHLLDDCRMDIASRELTASRHISLSQMALRLGYSDHSTFSRAFARWFGTSPRTFRAEMSGASA